MMEYGTRREKRWSGTQHLRGMVVQQSTNPPAQLGVCPPLQEGDADKLAALTEFFAQQGCGWSTRSRVDLAHAWRTTRRLCKGACAPNQAFGKRVDHVVLHIPVQYRYTYRFSMLDLPVLYRIPHEVCERTGLCCQLDSMPSFGAIKLLQTRTGASRNDCKRALEEHNDDVEAAAAALGEKLEDQASSTSSSGAVAPSANQRALDSWFDKDVDVSVSVVCVEAGDGVTFPVAGDTVIVHYRGRLQTDGSEFDSSYTRNRPFSFTLGVGEVIRGWDEGVSKMSLGEKAELLVKSDFAYGANGHGKVIPPNADLWFEMRLIEVHRAGTAPPPPKPPLPPPGGGKLSAAPVPLVSLVAASPDSVAVRVAFAGGSSTSMF